MIFAKLNRLNLKKSSRHHCACIVFAVEIDTPRGEKHFEIDTREALRSEDVRRLQTLESKRVCSFFLSAGILSSSS